MVVVLFWSLDFPAEADKQQALHHVLTFFVHGVNFVLMIINFVLSRHPYHVRHGLYVFIYLVTYVLFSVVYWAAGGTDASGNKYIYAALDWDTPKATVPLILGLIFFMIPAVVGLFAFAARLRDRSRDDPAARNALQEAAGNTSGPLQQTQGAAGLIPSPPLRSQPVDGASYAAL